MGVERSVRGKLARRLRWEWLEPRIALANSPVISEFLASNGTTLLDEDGDASDWIEIHNPAASAVDLDGWYITDEAADLSKWRLPSVSIPPGGYLLVFASDKGRSEPAGELHTNFRLAASGEYLALVEPDGQTIAHAYAPAFPPQSRDVSYGLDLSGQPSLFPSPTPRAANTSQGGTAAGVVINEIMYHPAGGQDADEFIELHDAGGQSVSLAGWRFSDGIEFIFGNVTIPAGGYLVVAADPAAFAANYPLVTNVVGGWNGRLSNSAEQVRLEDAEGRVVDVVAYADEGDWSVRERGPEEFGHEGWVWSDAHDGGGSSLELVTAALPKHLGHAWRASTAVGGTPGRENSVLQVDAPPLIAGTAHAPIIPTSSDAVTVTARVFDESPTGVSASVFYRADGEDDFVELAMRDDGQAGDSAAGDGLFTALLPPQVDGTVVEFYIAATDAAGHTRTAPAAAQPSGEQLTNYLYEVDDEFDWSPGDMPLYRLIMTEAEREELAQIGSNPLEGRSHARMNGTLVTVDEQGAQFRYNVGIRNRGQGSRAMLPNSYHVDIPTDRPWNGVYEFNLNTQFTHLQLVGMRMHQAAGLVAEDARAVRVLVNGENLSDGSNRSFGVYVHLEEADSNFAANHFPGDEDGNLYRIVRNPTNGRPFGDLRVLEDEADYRIYYEKKTNSAEDDYSDLIALVDVLNNAPDATYLDEVRRVANVQQWLDYFAVSAILNTRETSLATGVGDDYLLYRGENDPRFVLLPHDYDSILGAGFGLGNPTDGIYRAGENPVIARFLFHPEILPQYHETLARLLDTTFSRHSFSALVDELLPPFVPADEIADLKSFLEARREFIRQEIAAPLTATSGLPISGGYQFTRHPSAALSGTAPLVGTRSVLVNGLPAEYDPVLGEWTIGDPGQGQVLPLVPAGSAWQYLDAGRVPSTAPGADWRIDDLGWTDAGSAPLGYGNDDEATTVSFVDTDPEESGSQRNITTYFRHAFHVEDATAVTALTIRLVRDDGAVIYLNGAEFRSNMPEGPIDDKTTAASAIGGSEEEEILEIPIDPAVLVDGENILAVEIHQAAPSSSDIRFDLELQAVIGDTSASGGVPLLGGVNRIVVEAFSGPGGTGRLLDSTSIDVWHDDGTMQEVLGEISSDTLWTADAGPYRVRSTVTLTGGATLSIEPGTTVFFDEDASLVAAGGRILAEGTPYARIRFAPVPGGGEEWNGVALVDAPLESRFRYVDFEGGDADGEATSIDHAAALFEYVSWLDVDEIVIDAVHPTLFVRNSVIPSVSGDETVHLSGMEPGNEFVFEGNIIGMNTSGGDVFDVGHDTLDPPTIYFRNNVFLGGFDDGLDTDGFPAVIEGNTFTNFHYATSRQTTSNAVSTGHANVDGQIVPSRLALKNNTFYDVDHALLLKDGSFAELAHNTIVGATIAAIQFNELVGTNVIGPGRGADIEGVIFSGTAELFEHLTPQVELTVDCSIAGTALTDFGTGNLVGDPLLVDPAAGDFRLRPGSPAMGAGPGGTDVGAIPFDRADTLRISELNYHPHDPVPGSPELAVDADQFEFVELVNTSNTATIDLAGVHFTQGIEFDFTTGSVQQLAPGERVLIVKNGAAFESRYGTGHAVAGQFTGGTALSNAGERLRLENALGEVLLDFTYADGFPWPAEADGLGRSLVAVDTQGDYDSPANWRASTLPGGSPGADESPGELLHGDYNGNGLVEQADLDLVLVHWGRDVSVPPVGWINDLPSGIVDQRELDSVLANWGRMRSAAVKPAVPQPVALTTAAAERADDLFEAPRAKERVEQLAVLDAALTTFAGSLPRR